MRRPDRHITPRLRGFPVRRDCGRAGPYISLVSYLVYISSLRFLCGPRYASAFPDWRQAAPTNGGTDWGSGGNAVDSGWLPGTV